MYILWRRRYRILAMSNPYLYCINANKNMFKPTKDKKELQLNFIKYIQQTLLDYMDKHIMLGGDFNICLQPEIDKKGGTIEKQSESAVVLESLMEEFNLSDVWRLYNPDTLRYSRREMSKGGSFNQELIIG